MSESPASAIDAGHERGLLVVVDCRRSGESARLGRVGLRHDDEPPDPERDPRHV
ncbi:hypothetical protein [Embleya sp. NPDC005971]|uniref:hypothetical protein n=1 Tax=Embleya sp. NPDC005971 TaxID=3156724 RepID=UPI0033D46867